MALSDKDILEILYLRDVTGYKMSTIARKMGMSRNRVIGIYHRCYAPPSVGDGSMPQRWWEEGLRRRKKLMQIVKDIDL